MKKQAFVLFLMTGIGQFTLDAYLPSLPHLTNLFNVTPNAMQYSLGIFLITMGLSQPLYGILSDKYGRRNILILGTIIILIGSLLCSVANSLNMFLVGRFLQGLGVGATSTLCKAVARDLYSGDDLKRIMSVMISVWAIALTSAPLIGGTLQTLFGWRSVFISGLLLQLWLLLLLLLSFVETNNSLNKKSILSSLFSFNISLLNLNAIFFQFTIIAMLCTAVIYSFNLTAPFFIQIDLGFNPFQYGLLSFLIALGYAIGSTLTQQFIKTTAVFKIIKYLALAFFIISFIMFIFSISLKLSLLTFLVPVFFLSIIVGFIISYAMPCAFGTVVENFGLASSIYGLFIFGGGFICNVIVSTFIHNNFVKYSILILIISVFLLISLRTLSRYQSRTALVLV